VRLLKSRAKSRARLEQALEARGFSASDIAEALKRVSELGYLDDGRYSEAKAASELKTGRSLDNVRRRLEAEGVDEDVAAEAVSRAAVETGHDDLAAAKALVQKRKLTGARAARFLASRGFAFELIERVVRLPTDD
jgi:regulatory protein